MARPGKAPAKPKKKAKKPGARPGAPSTAAGAAAPTVPAVWQPGVNAVAEDEALQYDPTAYDCFHAFTVEWPCLSFDIVRDDLGGPRSTFPHTVTLAAGTQAATPRANALALLRLSNLNQGKHGTRAGKGEDDSSSDDDMSDSEGEDHADSPPVLHYKQLSHMGGINRVRVMPQQSGVVATWGDNGLVQVWDASAQIAELATAADERPVRGKAVRQAPRHAHSHAQEGYALDWSPVATGRLASGDSRRNIHVWEAGEHGGWTVSAAYPGHEASVEDLQWSPTEATVFISASADRSIRVWDMRERTRPMITVAGAHDADVNVISWSRLANFMLASGGDDGVLRVWDLRHLSDAASRVAHLTHHKGPIASVEWSPAESSMLLTTSSDGQLAVWDLSLERDPEEEAVLGAASNASVPENLPPQLLFVHAGQTDLKEAHWHPQIPGMIVSTAADGFNVFRPSNV